MSDTRGFTLIEVMVALVIMALAFAAWLRASGVAADNSDTLRERMLAGWMAENRMALLQARREWPAPGVTNGRFTQDDRTWVWQQQVSAMNEPGLRRVEIRILAPGSDYTLATLVSYVAGGHR